MNTLGERSDQIVEVVTLNETQSRGSEGSGIHPSAADVTGFGAARGSGNSRNDHIFSVQRGGIETAEGQSTVWRRIGGQLQPALSRS